MLGVLLLLLAGSASPARDFRAAMQSGLAALDRNQLPTAQASFEEAARLAPRDARVWMLLAQTYGKLKKNEPASAAAKKADVLGGTDPQIAHGLAYFYTDLQPDPARAAAFEQRYAEKTPQDKTAWSRVARLYFEARKPVEAIAAGKRSVVIEDTADMRILLGRAYEQQKQWDSAAEQMRRAVKLRPFDEQTHFRLAEVHLLQQDFHGAITVLEEARRTFDRSAQIELALGVAYYGLRDFPRAVDQFIATMRLDPDVPQSYAFIGRILDHAGDRLPELTERFAALEKRHPESHLGYLLHAKALMAQMPPGGLAPEAETAMALLHRSIALKSDDSDSHYQLALLLERKGDLQAAAGELERSIALDPSEAPPHYRLARVYGRLGRREDADKHRALYEQLSESAGPVK